MRPSILLVCAALIATALPILAQTKQWTDENGVIHFDAGPPPPKQPDKQPDTLHIKLRKPQPFRPPSDARKLREAAERYLADLGLSLTAARVQVHTVKVRGNIETLGRTGSSLLQAQYENAQVLSEVYVKLFIPIRSDLLSLEKALKDRNDGTLPQWVKDNRDWRELDAEFGPKK